MLTIKEVAAYLPYNTKILNGWGDIKKLNYTHLDDENNGFIVGIKLLLRPLSDLVNEIEHNGERFVPIERLNDMHVVDISEGFDKSSYWIKQRGGSYLIKAGNIEELPYILIQKLTEWHFDIYNLIPKNLAIDLNNIK